MKDQEFGTVWVDSAHGSQALLLDVAVIQSMGLKSGQTITEMKALEAIALNSELSLARIEILKKERAAQ